jgi:hypothetical protein
MLFVDCRLDGGDKQQNVLFILLDVPSILPWAVLLLMICRNIIGPPAGRGPDVFCPTHLTWAIENFASSGKLECQISKSEATSND